MCVLIFSAILFETFFILRRTKQDMAIDLYWSLYKLPVILVRW